jgi:hypothetical protein
MMDRPYDAPGCCRGGRLQKAINDAVEAGIKRGFLSPSYMREAWRAEMRMLAAEKLSHAEMLVGFCLCVGLDAYIKPHMHVPTKTAGTPASGFCDVC